MMLPFLSAFDDKIQVMIVLLTSLFVVLIFIILLTKMKMIFKVKWSSDGLEIMIDNRSIE